jgi:hypothetical protein
VFLSLAESSFRYSEDQAPNWLARWHRSLAARKVASRFRPVRLIWEALLFPLRLVLMVWALTCFDVFIFHGTSSFFRYYELGLFRLLGKKVVYIFLGSDGRPPYINGIRIRSGMSTATMAREARRIKDRVLRIERHADLIVCNPLSGQFHERPFLNGLYIGFPFNEAVLAQPPEERSTIRILHAPSHGPAKGTSTIRTAIATLKEKGYAIDFVELSGRPHSEVMEELRHCDFVVDELYSDTLMAGLGTEAASCGRPVIVGGYENDDLGKLVPPDLLPPVLRTEPEAVEIAIMRLIDDTAFRRDLGARAAAFLQRQTPERVASRLMEALAGGAPQWAWFDPRSARFIHGTGIARDALEDYLSSFIAAEGASALMVDDKPELRHAFQALAQRKPS